MSEDKIRNPERPDVLPQDSPEPDQPDTPTWRAVKKGAKWGAIAGLVIAQILISAGSVQTPFGAVYVGNMFAVFAICIGLGSALGVGFGWLNAHEMDSDGSSPSPP